MSSGAAARSVSERARRVLALGRDQHDLLAAPGEARRGIRDRDLERHGLPAARASARARGSRGSARRARSGRRRARPGADPRRPRRRSRRRRGSTNRTTAATCIACRTTGRRAAPASSSRRTGVVYGAPRAISGSSRASRRIAATISAKRSSVSLVSVSVGSTISASSTISGKYTVGGWTPWSSRRLARSSVLISQLAPHRLAREHELVHAQPVVGGRQVLGDALARAAAPAGSWRSAPRSRRPRAARARRASGCRRRSGRTRRSCPGTRAGGRSTSGRS